MSSKKKEPPSKKGTVPAKRRTSKLEKQRNFLVELASQLDPRWKQVCAPSMEQNLFGRRGDYFYTFPSSYVHQLLISYVENPGKIRKSTVSKLAQQINEKFSLIESSSFLGFDFLSSENEFETKLKEYSLDHLKTYRDLVKTQQVDEGFFRVLEEGRSLAALVHLLDDKLGVLLLEKRDAASATRSFANSTQARGYRYIMQTSGVTTAFDKLKLANSVYQSALERATNERRDDDSRFELAFEMSLEKYATIQDRLNEYRSFLKDRYSDSDGQPMPHRPSWAVSDATKHSGYIPLLLARKFAQLDREQHGEYFRWTELPSNHLF